MLAGIVVRSDRLLGCATTTFVFSIATKGTGNRTYESTYYAIFAYPT